MPSAATNYSLTPRLRYFCTTLRVEFSRNCLKQDKITYDHRKIASITLLMRQTEIMIQAVIQHWKIVYLLQLY